MALILHSRKEKRKTLMFNLLIEKNQLHIAEVLSRKIRAKFDIQYFNDVNSAYNEIRSENFKILILDIDQGKFLNYKNILQSSSYKNKYAVIALTSDDSLENIRNLKENNINEIIIKPIDKTRLNKILYNILNQREQL